MFVKSMFCGIISKVLSIKKVRNLDNGKRILLPNDAYLFENSKIGDSVALDGACHSIEEINGEYITFFSSQETLSKTIVGNYQENTPVNIELPMKLNDRIDGHIVSGHIDCIGKITNIVENGEVLLISVEFPAEFMELSIYKGSITINGISLTINSLHKNIVDLCIIPITIKKTNLNTLKVESLVNVEFDIVGKYISRKLFLNQQ